MLSRLLAVGVIALMMVSGGHAQDEGGDSSESSAPSVFDNAEPTIPPEDPVLRQRYLEACASDGPSEECNAAAILACRQSLLNADACARAVPNRGR